MKIRYKKKWQNFYLIIGLIFIVIGIIAVSSKENIHWTQYGYLIIGIVYLGGYFYQQKKQYLSIEENILKINGFKTKQINLNEIESIRKFGGDYKFNYQGKEIIINTQIIDPESLNDFNKELEKYNIEWN